MMITILFYVLYFFTIIRLGFNPRISLENFDVGTVRIEQIRQLIRESKFSIHDLSRIQAGKKGEIFRLNMPFELGMDIGCRFYSNNHLKEKKFLVLETERYRYMKALSDLNGSDIKHHDNDPTTLVRQVRNWFVEGIGLKKLPSASSIWYEFTDFMSDFYDKRENEGFEKEDLEMMPIPEFIDFMKEWVSEKF